MVALLGGPRTVDQGSGMLWETEQSRVLLVYLREDVICYLFPLEVLVYDAKNSWGPCPGSHTPNPNTTSDIACLYTDLHTHTQGHLPPQAIQVTHSPLSTRV